MRGGQKSLQLEAPLARALRIALGVCLLAVLLLVLDAAGSFAATHSSADEPASSTSQAKRPGLLSGIVNPVAGIVDQTLNQVPVVNEITGSETVATALEPVAGAADRLENTLNSIPVVAAATAPVQEAAAAVVPPAAGVVADVAAAVVPPVANVVSGVTAIVLPPVVTEVVLPPVVDVVSGITAGVLPQVVGTVPAVTAPVLGVVDHVVDTAVTPVLPQVPGVPAVPALPLAPAAPGTPVVPVAPDDLAGQGVRGGTHNPQVDGTVQSGTENGSGAAQEPPASKPSPAQASKSHSAARDGADSAAQDAAVPVTVNGVSPLAQYVTANIVPGAWPVSGAAAKSLAVQPDRSPASAACGSDADGSVVGPCPPAMPASIGSSSIPSASGPGASGGSSAADENSAGNVHLAGRAVALPDADWPLPASMPSNPGSTPG